MAAKPSENTDKKVYPVKPSSDLAAITNHKIKVTGLDTDYIMGTGFTTGDGTIPTVISIQPSDGTTDVPPTTSISVTFSEAMDTSSITDNFSDTVCSGSIQLSSNDFSTCIQMNGIPSSDDNLTYTVQPASNLSLATIYKIKVSSVAEDAVGGNTIGSDYIFSSGFTTYDPGFTISSISGSTTEAGTATFSVNLNSEPTADVTIGVSSDDITEGTATPSSLIFSSSDWNTIQTVSVIGMDDSLVDGNRNYLIVLASASSNDSGYNTLDPTDVTVVNINDDYERVPDTGQTTCYDNRAVIACPSSGLFYGQDASYSINAPSYTDNGDESVSDNVTGLMWQKEDNNTLYQWNDSITYCQNSSLAGYVDWRLPDVKELGRIVYSGTTHPSISSVFINTKSSRYWSSTESSGNEDYTWALDFTAGWSVTYDKLSNNYVRCVRGDSRLKGFVDNENGTITDSISGLIWQKREADGAKNWQESITYCNNYVLAGYDDWRLPNVTELESIIDYTMLYPSVDTLYFPDITYLSYWSSTTLFGQINSAKTVYFPSGNIYYGMKSDSFYVKCVRNEQ